MENTDELSNSWCEGWKAACLKFKDAINEIQQKAGDSESQVLLSELFLQVKNLEKTAFSEMPTLIANKPLKTEIKDAE